MKISVTILTFTLTFTSLFAQWGDNYIKLSHKITTESKKITGFDKIEVSEDFEVYIKFSDKEETVAIEANENLHDLILVEQKGKTLKIHTKPYSTKNWGRKGGASERLVAYITAKQLTEIRGDEDVIIELKDKLYTDNLTIHLNEDSALKGHLEVQNLIVDLDEDSFLDIEGSAQSMIVDANEDSRIKGFDFVVNNLEIELNEDSEVKLTVNGEIDLLAKEDSNFHYRGAANFIRKRLRGDSEVKAY